MECEASKRISSLSASRKSYCGNAEISAHSNFSKTRFLQRRRIVNVCPEENNLKLRLRIAVPMPGAEQLLAYCRVHAQLFAKLALESLRRKFARLDFASGEFPFESVRVVAAPLANQ